MITCTECTKPNSLDSKFCRACGAPISSQAIEEATRKNLELIELGKKALSDSRLDEAMMIAHASIEADPSAADAYALLADCQEREGYIAEALTNYERVVELRPDAPLDRIKVAHLRKLLAAASLVEVDPRQQKRALWLAISSTVLVASIGAVLAITLSGDDAASGQVQKGPDITPNASQVAQNVVPRPSTSGVQTSQVGATPQAVSAQIQSGTAGTVSEPPRTVASTNVPALPSATDPRSGDEGFRPLVPPIPSGKIEVSKEAGSNGSQAAAPKDPEPKPERSSFVVENKGIIDIKPSQQAPRQVGGSETIENRSAVGQNLVRVARQHFQLGNYSDAAEAYEKALRAGADPATTNQRLAQSYEKLGRRADAIEAYTRAALAYEAILRFPSADSTRARAGLNVCRQAVKILQGG